MIENFRKLPQIEPEQEDESPSQKVVGDADFPFNAHELTIGKRVEIPNAKSVPDLMGKVREDDPSAKAAKAWLKENDPEEKKKSAE